MIVLRRGDGTGAAPRPRRVAVPGWPRRRRAGPRSAASRPPSSRARWRCCSSPGSAAAGRLVAGLAVLVVAVGAPAVLAAWQQRLPRSGRGRAAGGYSRPGQTGPSQPSLGYGALGYGRRGRRRFRGGVRLVVEVAAVLAAVGGIVVFRQQGSQPGAARGPLHQRRARAGCHPRRHRRAAGLPAGASRLAARRRPQAECDRVPRPGPGRAGQAHPRVAGVRAGPRDHRGRLRRHGPGRGDPRRDQRLLAGRGRGRGGQRPVRVACAGGRSPPPPSARSRPCRACSTRRWCRSGWRQRRAMSR